MLPFLPSSQVLPPLIKVMRFLEGKGVGVDNQTISDWLCASTFCAVLRYAACLLLHTCSGVLSLNHALLSALTHVERVTEGKQANCIKKHKQKRNLATVSHAAVL